jgi:hypothetical protein
MGDSGYLLDPPEQVTDDNYITLGQTMQTGGMPMRARRSAGSLFPYFRVFQAGQEAAGRG